MSPRPFSIFGLLIRGLYSVYAMLIFCINTFLLICPLILVLPGVILRRNIGAIGVRFGLLVMGIPFRVVGTDKLPPGPCIVVSNHASYMDGMIMTSALPRRFSFLIQHGVASWFYAGRVLQRMGYRFINRESAREGAVQTRALLRGLQDGESLAIFAEGTFKAEPGLLPFKNGAFLLAHKSGLPVVPVAIRGTRRLLGGGMTRFRWSSVTVEFGDPIAPQASARELRDITRARVLALCGEPDAQAGAADGATPTGAEAA